MPGNTHAVPLTRWSCTHVRTCSFENPTACQPNVAQVPRVPAERLSNADSLLFNHPHAVFNHPAALIVLLILLFSFRCLPAATLNSSSVQDAGNTWFDEFSHLLFANWFSRRPPPPPRNSDNSPLQSTRRMFQNMLEADSNVCRITVGSD
jgi:hypothetical protein